METILLVFNKLKALFRKKLQMGGNGVTDTWEFQNKSICNHGGDMNRCFNCIDATGSMIIESIMLTPIYILTAIQQEVSP